MPAFIVSLVSFFESIAIFIVFCIFLSTILLIFLYRYIGKQNKTINRQKNYEYQIEVLENYIDKLLINQDKLRKFKHDFSNHLVALTGYFNSMDFDGGLKYLSNINEIVNIDKKIDTGNIVLDTIINTKKALAESKGINVDLNIQIREKVSIDSIDICIIFGNALDNAIEACEKIDNDERKISLSLIYDKNSISCRIVKNSLPNGKEITITTKKDKKNHGMGLKSIKTALSNYKNIFQIKQTENKFILSFVIFCS